MADTPTPDELSQEIRAEVDRRRAAGEYPEGLEADLDLHYHHIAVRGVRDRFERLRSALEEADDAGRRLSAARISNASERAAGGVAHRLIGKLVRRQVEGTLTQVREYADALAEAHRALLLAHADLVTHLDEVRERLDALEQRPGGGAGS